MSRWSGSSSPHGRVMKDGHKVDNPVLRPRKALQGTGRFNVAQRVFGTMMGIGASVSPTLTGLIVDRFGYSAGFVGLAVGGLLALLVLVLFMPETKEDRPT